MAQIKSHRGRLLAALPTVHKTSDVFMNVCSSNKLRRSKLRGIQRRRGLVLPRIGSKEFHLACIQRSKVDGVLVQTLVLVLATLLLDVAADRLLAAVTPYGVYEVAA